MGKRIITAILLLILTLNCTGCSGPWRRKFVRKKKVEVKEEPVLQPEDYSKEFTNGQLYANHFAFWRAAESELISSLKGRKPGKRLKTYASYAVEELKKLHGLLIEEKQKELSLFIEELKEIMVRINQPAYLNSHWNFLVDISSKHYRTVSRRFSYYSMKDYIRLEEKSEELAETGPPEPEQEAIERPELETLPGDETTPQETTEAEEPRKPEEPKQPEAEPEKQQGQEESAESKGE